MANTYTQIYIHIIFAVKGRQNLISESFREQLQKFITGILQNRGQKMLAIYCMPDHSHILTGLTPAIALSNLVRDIKAGSSKFINDKKLVRGKFNWQQGFGGFSYSRSQIDTVVKYILNQKEHHKERSFKEEYIELLEKFEVQYDDEYLFKWIDVE